MTLAVLHGACVKPHDPTCKMFNLYPVESCVKFKFEGGRLRRCKLKEASEEKFLKGQFCQLEFPKSFPMFSYATCNDCDFMNAIFRSNEELPKYPLFEHQYPLTVAYINSKYTNKLRNQNAESQVKVMEKYQVRAANLQGCLLHMIARSGCKSNVAVVLAIGDTLGPHGSGLPREPKAVKKIVSCFIMAVVLAGLPKGIN